MEWTRDHLLPIVAAVLFATGFGAWWVNETVGVVLMLAGAGVGLALSAVTVFVYRTKHDITLAEAWRDQSRQMSTAAGWSGDGQGSGDGGWFSGLFGGGDGGGGAIGGGGDGGGGGGGSG